MKFINKIVKSKLKQNKKKIKLKNERKIMNESFIC